MKKSLFIFILLSVFAVTITNSLSAGIWRINNLSNYDGSSLWGSNFGGTAAYPVFKQINQAVGFGLVNNGDTLYVEGSTIVYDFATITKRLVIIGTGYFLDHNPGTSNGVLETRLARILFSPGSENSQLIGVDMVSAGNSFDRDIYINVNGITVKRCRIEGQIVLGFPLSDVYILQNFFSNAVISNAIATNGNSFFTPPTDLIFNNNIVQKTLVWGTPFTNPTTFWPILQCNNNVFDGPDNLGTPNLAFSTSEFKNNILMATNAIVNISASAGNVSYNIGTLSTQFGTVDHNLVVPDIGTVFMTSTSPDGAYQIKAGSAAVNSGSDGTDRGAFGGTTLSSRYTLSGLAAIPVIYKITIPGASSSSLPVTIQARTIK